VLITAHLLSLGLLTLGELLQTILHFLKLIFQVRAKIKFKFSNLYSFLILVDSFSSWLGAATFARTARSRATSCGIMPISTLRETFQFHDADTLESSSILIYSRSEQSIYTWGDLHNAVLIKVMINN
jgi:hypothetical protein